MCNESCSLAPSYKWFSRSHICIKDAIVPYVFPLIVICACMYLQDVGTVLPVVFSHTIYIFFWFALPISNGKFFVFLGHAPIYVLGCTARFSWTHWICFDVNNDKSGSAFVGCSWPIWIGAVEINMWSKIVRTSHSRHRGIDNGPCGAIPLSPFKVCLFKLHCSSGKLGRWLLSLLLESFCFPSFINVLMFYFNSVHIHFP